MPIRNFFRTTSCWNAFVVQTSALKRRRAAKGVRCEHEIVSTAFMGWTKLKNGEVLRAAEGLMYPERNGIATGDR